MSCTGVPTTKTDMGAKGPGYEIAEVHPEQRVAAKFSPDAKAVAGLPEVTLGLLPGAGGVVRLTKLLGLEKALPYLLEGKQAKPEAALKMGMGDEIVETEADLIPAAKAWIKANPDAHTQPWDERTFRYPGGDTLAPKNRQIIQASSAMLYAKTRGLLPAPEKILDIAVNSMRMGFESALRVESRGLAALIPTPECKAAISTFFFGMQAITGGPTTYVSAEMSSCVARAAPSLSNDDILPRWRA